VRDEELPPLRAQWLIYPITDWGGGTRSRKLFAHGFLLDEPQIEWFHRHYLPGDEVDDFRASPLRARSLAGLPPALVSTAGFDPLRDEGEAYAARLAREGTRAIARRRESLIHGFAGMRFATSACAAVDEDIAWLKAELDRA
ncbi:MAG: alpha/beta hydrolase fold domain-containing protein, partial [Polyangiaceae bacterium]|nr:alpha/beta hydrolase fold domain-containing protein [Polyangiaceae bacterium]